MSTTQLHQINRPATSTSWRRLPTVALTATTLGLLPAGVAAATPNPEPAAVVTHAIPRDHDNTMQQHRRHDRQRDQRQDRRTETTILDQILLDD
ncbi:hypothetical protein ACFWAY_47545 [Rhodococcus sp. NPDC059968]|uniref:hypothetical protein n=1 Tax=Rhodococcus sp. NPDC059968 TaxID=3347017 RepID=UPI00366E5306